MSIVTKAVVSNPDGTLFLRHEHEWAVLSPEMETALIEGLTKQKKFLDDLKSHQTKTPEAVYSAVLSVTGYPDASFDAFTYDSYQKALHGWNVMVEELARMGDPKQSGTPGNKPETPPGQSGTQPGNKPETPPGQSGKK